MFHKSLTVHPSTPNPWGQLSFRGTTIAAVCISETHPHFLEPILTLSLKTSPEAVLCYPEHNSEEIPWAQPVSTPRTGDQPPLSGAAGTEVVRRMSPCKDRVIYQLDCNAYKYYNCITGCPCSASVVWKQLMNQEEMHDERWQFDFKPPQFPLTVSGFWCAPHRRMGQKAWGIFAQSAEWSLHS